MVFFDAVLEKGPIKFVSAGWYISAVFYWYGSLPDAWSVWCLRLGVGVLQLAPPLPPLPSVGTNCTHKFMKPWSVLCQAPLPLSIEPSSVEPSSTKPLSIKSIFSRTYSFIELLSVHNQASLRLPITNNHFLHFRTSIRSIMQQLQFCEIDVAIQLIFDIWGSFSTLQMLSAFHDEVASAIPWVWCFGWMSHIFVTKTTKSPRMLHLNDVVNITYELWQWPV